MYERALDLLAVNYNRGRDSFPSGRGGGGRQYDLTQDGPAWMNKDYSSGSVGKRNERIRDEQIAEKTREAYERETRDRITRDMQNQDEMRGNGMGPTPLTEKQKEEREKRVDKEMEKYDKSPKAQKEAFQKYRPDLSSQDRNQMQRDEREAAREAVRDYIKESKDNFTKDAKGFGDDSFIKKNKDTLKKDGPKEDNKEKEDGAKDDETKPTTGDKASAAESGGDPTASIQQQITAHDALLQTHTQQISELYSLISGC